MLRHYPANNIDLGQQTAKHPSFQYAFCLFHIKETGRFPGLKRSCIISRAVCITCLFGLRRNPNSSYLYSPDASVTLYLSTELGYYILFIEPLFPHFITIRINRQPCENPYQVLWFHVVFGQVPVLSPLSTLTFLDLELCFSTHALLATIIIEPLLLDNGIFSTALVLEAGQ